MRCDLYGLKAVRGYGADVQTETRVRQAAPKGLHRARNLGPLEFSNSGHAYILFSATSSLVAIILLIYDRVLQHIIRPSEYTKGTKEPRQTLAQEPQISGTDVTSPKADDNLDRDVMLLWDLDSLMGV